MAKVRSYLALASVILFLVFADIVLRLVVSPLTRAFPSHRHNMLVKWAKAMAHGCLAPFRILRVIAISRPPEVPGTPGTLVVMNHQSVWDIPIMIWLVKDNFVRIVTRARYVRRYLPTVSKMVMLFGFPVVNPGFQGKELRRSLLEMKSAARKDDAPLGIFPEGTRTKDGEIGEFRTAGMKVLLRARPWTVHALVSDGLWRQAKVKHLVASPEAVSARVEHAGVFEWSDPRADADPFIDGIRRRMVEKLHEMRRAA